LKSAYILFVGLFSVNIGQSILAPVLPPLVRELGLSELQGGLIMGFSAVMWVIFSPIWGRRSEVWGRKPVFLISLMGYTLGVGTFGIVMQMGLDGVFATSLLTWVLLVLARMVVGTLYSGSVPASQAYVADTTTGQTRTNALGVITAAGSLGRIFGPALGGIVIGLGLVVPIFLSALLPMIGALLVLFLLPSIKPNMKQGQVLPRLSPFDPRIWHVLFIGLTVTTTITLVNFSVAFLFQDRLQLSTGETAQMVGLAFVASGCAALFAQTVLIRTFQWSPLTLMKLGLPILLMASLLLLTGQSFAVLSLGLVFQGLGSGLAFPGYRSAISFSVNADEQGAAAGLVSAVGGTGGIFGPIIGTGLYGINSTYPYLLSVMIILCGIGILMLMMTTSVKKQPV
jgi:MFS family permease